MLPNIIDINKIFIYIYELLKNKNIYKDSFIFYKFEKSMK